MRKCLSAMQIVFLLGGLQKPSECGGMRTCPGGQWDPRGPFSLKQTEPVCDSMPQELTFFFFNGLFSPSCFPVVKAIHCCFPMLVKDHHLFRTNPHCLFICLSVMAAQVSWLSISFPAGLFLSVTPPWLGWASHVSCYAFLGSVNSNA